MTSTLTDPFLKGLIEEFTQRAEVECIALGGSHTLSMNDKWSDFDLYVYLNQPLSIQRRKQITDKYCQSMELNQTFWETEDDGVLKSGIEVEIIYRNLDDMEQDLDALINQHRVSLGYSTCFWANLLNCQIMFERDNKLSQLKQTFGLPYPDALANAIIEKNLPLLCDAFPNYPKQIKKALLRHDSFSVLHRTNEYLASYFDVLFALNKIPHPGEKRLIDFAEEHCEFLPINFKKTLESLFESIHITEQCHTDGSLISALNDATNNLVSLIDIHRR